MILIENNSYVLAVTKIVDRIDNSKYQHHRLLSDRLATMLQSSF